MATGNMSSPARRLFRDVTDSSSQALLKKVSPEVEQYSLEAISRFQRRYDFDLLTMQPVSSTPNLPGLEDNSESIIEAEATPRSVRLRWSWEALDASQKYVPRFYRRQTYPVGVVSSRNSSVENTPPTPVKPGVRKSTQRPEREKKLSSGLEHTATKKTWAPHSHQTSLLAYFPHIRRPATATVTISEACKDQPTSSEPEGLLATDEAVTTTKEGLCKPRVVNAVVPACRGRSQSLPSPRPTVKSKVTSMRSARELSQMRLVR